ncbi:MAG TPA: DNA mismatch repair protein MutS [Thermoanaerobaculia bacterium]|nr:DNA mismatch repair protein MutS [Thermoanaerobaculia bacterium]
MESFCGLAAVRDNRHRMELTAAAQAANPTDISQRYVERVRALNVELAALNSRSTLISRLRLFCVATAVILAFPAFVYGVLNGWWVALPLAAFIALAITHERVIRRSTHLELRRKFNERGLERVTGMWMGRGSDGARFLDPSHPYAADLDIFGTGSLFQLLSSARTAAGEDKLAGWLAAPASIGEIPPRQNAVRELTAQLDLREELATIAEETAAAISPEELVTWSRAPKAEFAPWERLVASALSIVALPLFLLSLPGVLSSIARVIEPRFPTLTPDNPLLRLVPMLFLLIALAELGFTKYLGRRTAPQMEGISRAADDLTIMAGVLDLISAQTFDAPLLQALHDSLQHDGENASARVRRLARLLELVDAARNQFFAPFAALLLWRTHISFRVARWRAANGPDVEKWLETIGTFEALSSISSFAWENPGHVFPTVEETAPHFSATRMTHPLMKQTERVANDASLSTKVPLLLVSGSNMSGKSTYLRSIGTNTVLALAGSPVAASSMSLSPLRVGASLRIADSLQAGVSHFYAEVQKVKQIVDLTRQGPGTLFLLDEIFHGTNSHDRRIGAEAVIRSLLAAGAIGLVTTHDLALASIAEGSGRNVHFEDTIVDGRMTFDFKLREGVVEKSNALALMRAVGLDV